MVKEIITLSTYRGYELYAESKAVKGFYVAILDRLINLSEALVASKEFNQPRAFHITIEAPSQKKLKGLSNYLARKAAYIAKRCSRPVGSKIYYFIVHEQRHKNSGIHAHLYVFVDGWSKYEASELVRDLKRDGHSETANVKLRGRKSETFTGKKLILINAEDGECLREWKVLQKLASYHELNDEFEDFIKRASYTAKVKTKERIKGRLYSSSQLPRKAGALVALFDGSKSINLIYKDRHDAFVRKGLWGGV